MPWEKFRKMRINPHIHQKSAWLDRGALTGTKQETVVDVVSETVSDASGLRPRIAVAAIFLVNGTAFASWVPHIPTVQQKLALSPGVLGLALLAIAANS